MKSGRPYRTMSIDELVSKVRSSRQDMALLAEVAHELEFRSTQRAISLAVEVARLRDAGGHLAASDQDTPARQRAPSIKHQGARASIGRGSGGDDAPAGLTVEGKYSALRETFTAEAEVLSRWGLTSLAPAPLRELAIDYWRRVLAAGLPHPLDMTSADLERDVHALGLEQVGTAS